MIDQAWCCRHQVLEARAIQSAVRLVLRMASSENRKAEEVKLTSYATSTRILDEAESAQVIPWEPSTVLLYRTIIPQLTSWLPENEAAQLRFEFEGQLMRLKAA